MDSVLVDRYLQSIRQRGADAEGLELLYADAQNAGQVEAFLRSVESVYGEAPDNLLYAAWHFRLLRAAETVRRSVRWEVAVPLSALTGLVFWLLAGGDLYRLYDHIPAILLLASPVAAVAVLAFLAVVSRREVRLATLVAAGLALITVYAAGVPRFVNTDLVRDQYLDLAVLHVAVLSLAAVGVYLLRQRSDHTNGFAFVLKSLEIAVVGGLFVIAGAIFTAISFGLFEAIGISISDELVRLFVFGGGGLIPVLAVALVYTPELAPAGQSFGEGLSGLIGTLIRVLLPLTILVLAVYLALIPFNFVEPFRNRDTLITYNAMLFAVLGLLVGATPYALGELGARQQLWLRRGILTAASLALIISIYAFSAIAYRTWQYGFTLNRLTFVGWNVINIGILAWMLWRQRLAGAEGWLAELHATFGGAMAIYAGWSLFVVLLLPWLF